jgi:tetratricopeptide (TPR) repeat protein
MQHDRYGNPLGTQSAEAAASYVQGVDHILANTFGGVEAMAHAVALDAQFALGHIGHARALMYANDMGGARAAVDRAAALSDGSSDRERSQIQIYVLLMGGKPVEARAAVQAHVRDWPRDALVAQLNCQVFGLIGFSGCAGREAEMLAYTSALAPAYGEDWWFLSVHAQSLCENGRPDRALEVMERSLALYDGNANASHFKAHALYEMGQTAQGRTYLDDWMEGYDPRGLLHGHLSWHAALWALEQGDMTAFWRWYDGGVGPGTGPGSALPINVLTDAAALLWRAELAGQNIAPERWHTVSAYATERFANPGQSFADMHAALAHAMAGDGAALAKLAEASRGFAADLVRPVARGWQAVARQDWDGALEALTPVMADHARFGGSRAQRDLLELTWMLCLMRLGRKDEAKRAAATRRPVFADAAPLAGYA